MTAHDASLAGKVIAAYLRERWSPDALAEATILCERWGLSLTAVLGCAPVVPPGGLSSAVLFRIGALVGADRSLVVVMGLDQGREWLCRPNAAPGLAGRSPADLMERGGLPGLLLVRGILDAVRVSLFGATDDAVRLMVIQ